MPVIPSRLRLLVGLAGSLCLLAGSYGVGWIGPSSLLNAIAPLEALRSTRASVTVFGLLVVAGALLLFTAWLALGLALLDRSRRRPTPAHVAGSAAAWAAPLLFTLPLFSRDMFAYVGQGRLMAAGLDPYTTGMADLAGWFGIGVDPLWADTPTPYGPVFVWLERAVVLSTDALPTEVAVMVFRMLAAAGLALMAVYAWRLARLRGGDGAVTLWLVAASPLVLMNFVVAGHNDSIMLGFVLAGVYYALRDRPVLGALLVAVAIGVKPIAVVALPVIGLIWAGSAAGWGMIVRRWLAVAAVGIGSVVVLGWSIGVGTGWLLALTTPTAVSSWYAPANILGMGVGGLANGLGLDGELVQTVVKVALLLVGAGVATWLVTARRTAEPLWLLLAVFTAVVALSPVIHPWYGLWLLTLLGVAGVRQLWSVRTAVYSTAFFMLIGLAEPFDLVPRVAGDARIPSIVIGATLVGLATLLLLAEGALKRGVRARTTALSGAWRPSP
ncbi:polyprenol phosphomannose-dependent alpha 1,6 mannosyltransferase MptB [Herbiconiux moechotypicola]|uniref:DUF2029 domain-containing protein n=1 Tax=Herbiconiux moechotypicola TaxID=637393 RepID=A0ABN3D9S8_9MICO|nr:polyprenol phosphomannose-dependent alpha 1,6 mannosyltransferase MptB [Herbiconiux moechotypicola]MCS5729035.1 polyprenol phosphomannose-dependent alpha 1,6 mannosyltransferase MptB [Herbiconiux moechotypicola]